MEDGDAPVDGDTQRVRILSTLESTRRADTSRHRKGRRLQQVEALARRRRSPWPTRVLIGLMGAGVIALIVSFAMVVMDSHASAHAEADNSAPTGRSSDHPSTGSSPHQPGQAAVASDADNPLAALITTPPSKTPPPAGAKPAQAAPAIHAAVIENIAPPRANTLATAATSLTSDARRAAAPLPPALHTDAVQLDSADKGKPREATSREAPPAAKPPASPLAPLMPATRPRPANASGNTHDEDVALLEAMFAHTRPRTATPGTAPAPLPSVGEELRQRCGALTGPDAATCRAHICVQHPTAPACHQD